jgi:hypothetical protein
MAQREVSLRPLFEKGNLLKISLLEDDCVHNVLPTLGIPYLKRGQKNSNDFPYFSFLNPLRESRSTIPVHYDTLRLYQYYNNYGTKYR